MDSYVVFGIVLFVTIVVSIQPSQGSVADLTDAIEGLEKILPKPDFDKLNKTAYAILDAYCKITDKNKLAKVFSCQIPGTTPFEKDCDSLIYGKLDPVKRKEYDCKGGPEAKALDTKYDKCVEDKEKASGTTTTEEPVGKKEDALKKMTDMLKSVDDCVKNA